jgi:hypothetical protein
MPELKDYPCKLLQFGATLSRRAVSLWRLCLRRPLRCAAVILLSAGTVALGNRMYWGTPVHSFTKTSPDGRYRLEYYYPQESSYSWFAYQDPYFVKLYVHDGEGYRYRCTSLLMEGMYSWRTIWPDEKSNDISLGSESEISGKALEGFFLSPYPTKERICP